MSEGADGKGVQPRSWWQWALVYPTLFVSLVGAIPTGIELVESKIIYGVPFGDAKVAKEQAKAWRDNLTCTDAPFDFLTNPSNIKVDATICESGDVLVRVVAPNAKSYRWILVDSVLSTNFSGLADLLVSSARAQERLPNDVGSPTDVQRNGRRATVRCQRIDSGGNINRGIEDDPKGSGRCRVEVIDPYSGKVIRERVGPCDEVCR